MTIPDDEADRDEQRWATIGMGATGRLLVVVYTWRGDNIRIISVRVAEAYERDQYEAER
ncbi:MAG: BrnT family toxin [Candidatus Solibacter sp.]